MPCELHPMSPVLRSPVVLSVGPHTPPSQQRGESLLNNRVADDESAIKPGWGLLPWDCSVVQVADLPRDGLNEEGSVPGSIVALALL